MPEMREDDPPGCNPLSALSKKTPSSKVGDELRTSSLSVHMTIT